MSEPLGISDVKAKLAAICDRAARGEVIRFTRRRGGQVESFELRRTTPGTRELGAWRGRLSLEEVDSLSAPLSEEESRDWDI